MKIVIYTCIVGNYDTLPQPKVTDGRFDFVCFTDNAAIASNPGMWQIRPIPHEADALSPTRRSRYVKMLPHLAFKEDDYEASVWMDANIRICKADFYDTVTGMAEAEVKIAQVPHIQRDCIYDEIGKCYMDLRIGLADALRQRRHLKSMGFPRHYGLMENNLIFRWHGDDFVKKVSEAWWNEYLAFSERDQLSLMPIYWKESFRPSLVFGPKDNVRTVGCLTIVKHSASTKYKEIQGFRRIILKCRWTFRKIIVRILF